MQAIKLSQSSIEGYEMKHAILHGMGRHVVAVKTFNVMLSMAERASDVDIRSTLFP